MNIFPNDTLLKIPAVVITKDILDQYNAKYPKEEMSDIDVLREVYPNIVSLLELLPRVKKDRATYSMLCLLCQNFRGDGVKAIDSLFKAIGFTDADYTLTYANENIQITINSLVTTDATEFYKCLNAFIMEYAFDTTGDIQVIIKSVTLPINATQNGNLHATSSPGITVSSINNNKELS